MNLVSSTPRLDKYTENELLWAGLTGLSNFGPKWTFLTTSNSSVNSESSFLGWILYSTWQVSPYFTTAFRLALAKLYLKFEIMINIIYPSDKNTQPFIIFRQKNIKKVFQLRCQARYSGNSFLLFFKFYFYFS